MEESSLIAELRKNRTQYGEGVAFAYAIGEYERALKDVTTDGIDFTLKVWNKQHPEHKILNK